MLGHLRVGQVERLGATLKVQSSMQPNRIGAAAGQVQSLPELVTPISLN